MFLKKLSLNGFKSFCDYSEITFVKGISAIVGPNGCGKSNIIDSIKWVVGEQKTKMLRANNMADVIFKGTENRKGLGRAEVKLVLINEQNILPIDYNEVEISRVIYANGENEYYINKNKVRLKDIQELFYDTGIGKSAYSVMEQGKIDMILSNKPEDRRYIIEEAAGVTKYRVKRMEASSRLKQADENIIRIKDIIEEVKSQYENMKKQAEKAEKYRELNEREINLEIELNLNRIIKNEKIRDDYREKLKKANAELDKVKQDLENLEDGVEEKLKALNDLENQKIDNQREVYKIQSDINIHNSKIEILKDQLSQHEINLKTDNERVKVFENNIKEIEDELKNIDIKKSEYDENIIDIEKDIEFYFDNLSQLDAEISETDNSILELKNDITKSNGELEQKRNEQKSATEKLIVKMDQSNEVYDINDEEITRFKTNIKENISYIKSHLPQKRAFIDDMIRGGHITSESSKLLQILETLRDELKAIEDKVTLIDEDTAKYIHNTERFLDEIFGPEGVLTQKRKIEHDINELVDKISESNNKIAVLQEEIIKKRNKKEEFNKIIHELNINLTTVKEKKNSIDNEIKRLLTLKAHHENSMDEVLQKIEFYIEKITKINNELASIKTNIENIEQKKKSLEEELIEIDKKIKDENVRMSDQQKFIREINTKWMEKKNEVEQLNIKIVECLTTINNVYDAFYENYSIDLEKYQKENTLSLDRDYNDIKTELNDVKSNKHALGSVNLIAIEESKALEERYNLLIDQLEDLEKAKKDISEMIEKINKVSEDMFIKTFNQIKANFQKTFKKLFNGGNADIELTDPENILETGVDIIAHPPGQKTQSITLLSGGQRTMTAIALMFAAFFVKPSPFCLLDEIDAALDEQNIRRFVNLLTENKELSQFVIITHNNNTISAADVMYGVTQEEKGVSKIVSAKFAQKTS